MTWWWCPTCTNDWYFVPVAGKAWVASDTSGILGFVVEAQNPRCPFCRCRMEIRSTALVDKRLVWPVYVN